MDGAIEILEVARSVLEAQGFPCSLRNDGPAIETGYRSSSGVFSIWIGAQDEPALLRVVVRIPVVVPEPRRVEMAETVARANYGLLLGGFQLDMSDGELLFQASMPVADAAVTCDQVRHLLDASVWSVSTYFRAFNRLLYGDDLSPAEVIAEVEMAG